MNGEKPEDVDKDTWKIFETMAFGLIPKVNRYVWGWGRGHKIGE
jgi:hypothetical protein